MKIANFDEDHASALGGSTSVIAEQEADAAIEDHVADTTEAHQALGVAILDATGVRYWPMLALTSGSAAAGAGGYYASANVEGALAEIGGALRVITGNGVRYWPMLALTSAALAPAPATPDYLVGTAQAALSAEIVVGATPGGELGGTWPSPTVDPTHSGSAHILEHTHAATGQGATGGGATLAPGTIAPSTSATIPTLYVGTTDVRITRSAAGKALLDANGAAAATELAIDATSGQRSLLSIRVAGEANPRFRATGDATLAGIELGAGGASAPDTTLYRSGVNVLKTDGTLVATGFITIEPASGATIEGGEIALNGAAAYADWVFDNFQGHLRWFVGASVYMELDSTGLIVPGGLSGMTVHAPVESGPASADKSTTSATFVDIGAPFDQSVVAPPSGRVLLLAVLELDDPDAVVADVTIGYQLDVGADVICGGHAFPGSGPRESVTVFDVLTGLTAGTSYAVSLRWRTTSGTARIYAASRGAAGNGSRMILLPLA